MLNRRALVRGGSIVAAAVVAAVAIGLAALSGRAEPAAPVPTTTYSYDVDRPTALFLGDSYSQGIGAGAPSNSFTTIVAENRRWVQANWARGGTGYLAEPKDPKAACGSVVCPNYRDILGLVPVRDPKYVIVSGGRNDSGIPVALLDQAVQSFFTALHKQYPDSRVIAISPVWDSRRPPGSIVALGRVVESNVERVGGAYLDIGEPLENHRDWIVSDGIHPNDRGHAAIAHAVIVAMERDGIGPG